MYFWIMSVLPDTHFDKISDLISLNVLTTFIPFPRFEFYPGLQIQMFDFLFFLSFDFELLSSKYLVNFINSGSSTPFEIKNVKGTILNISLFYLNVKK